MVWKIILIVLLSICLAFIIKVNSITTGIEQMELSQKAEYPEVCFNDTCFIVEIAKTSLEKARGLMHREKLDDNRGMLFVYDKEGIYSFWMKNTLIPLDIIWINKNKEVVFIEKNVQPCKQIKCPSTRPNMSNHLTMTPKFS